MCLPIKHALSFIRQKIRTQEEPETIFIEAQSLYAETINTVGKDTLVCSDPEMP